MAYIIEKMEEQVMDAISNPAGWVERFPNYQVLYDANMSQRKQHLEVGTTIHTPEWKHVARIPSTLEDAHRAMNSDFLKDKKKFYGFLDRNPAYLVYDRRTGRKK